MDSLKKNDISKHFSVNSKIQQKPLKTKMKTRWNAIGFIDLSPLALEMGLNISTEKHKSHWFVHVSSDGTRLR